MRKVNCRPSRFSDVATKRVYAGSHDAWCEFARCFFILTVIIALAASLGGCSSIDLRPDTDVAPSRNAEHVWIAPASAASSIDSASQLQQLRILDEKGTVAAASDQSYDLPSLVDLALKLSPQTRHSWYTALEAQGRLGQSQARNYPQIGAESEGGYFKLPLEFPGNSLVVRNEAFLPQIKVSYDLLDFGRTRADERNAREQLITANYTFNQAVQDVVFQVERAYFTLSAAIASVTAAQANLDLADTARASVEKRHEVGLATMPQVLLARQVQAQAAYDLENAKSMVHDADAGLRQAVGVSANTEIRIEGGELDRMPKGLGDDVEALMTDTLKQRPEIAAKAASVHAADASIDRARSEYFPEIGVGGNYGQVIWSYTVNGGSRQTLNQPFYGAMMTLRWNLFTGFDRYYGVQKATAARDASRSELRLLQINAVAAVWRAYYDFLSAKRKRDAAEALLSSSDASFAANFESHRYGLATITDLISAEKDLMSARYTLIQAKADLLISSCTLAYATGAASRSSARMP